MTVVLNGTSGNLIPSNDDGSDTEMSITLLSVVAGITMMCLVGTYWAWRKDTRDRSKAGITVIPQHSYHRCPQHYLLMFYTGPGRHSGTTANVFCRIQGKQRETKPIVLRDPDRPMFFPSSRSSFLVTLNRSLDNIREIQLWHDLSGPSPAWFLESVVILHLNSDVTWYFEHNRWLDVSSGTGEVECKLQPLRRKELLAHKTLFDNKIGDNLKNQHLWWSWLLSTKATTLSRFQKMSTCLLLSAFMIMIVTILVRDTQSIFSDGSVQLGPWKLQLDDVYRALICSGIACLMRLLVEYLFLNSEGWRTITNHEKDVNDHMEEYLSKVGEIVFGDEESLNENAGLELKMNDEDRGEVEVPALEQVEYSDGRQRRNSIDSDFRNRKEYDSDLDSVDGKKGFLEWSEASENNNSGEMTGEPIEVSRQSRSHPTDVASVIDILGDLPDKDKLVQILERKSGVEEKPKVEYDAIAGLDSCSEGSARSSIVDNDAIDVQLEMSPERTSMQIKAPMVSLKRRKSEEILLQSLNWTNTVTCTDKTPKLWKQLPLPRHLVDDRSIKKQSNEPRKFPLIVLKITHALCFVLTVIFITVAMVVSFLWPVALTSWLVSLGLAFGSEIFVMEVLYHCVHAIYFAFWRRRPLKEQDLINELQNKVWVNEEQTSTYFVDDVDERDDDSVPNPPGPAAIEKAREKAGKDREMEDLIKMLLFDVLFLGLLILICSGNRDRNSYPVRVVLQDHFNISESFNQIKNTAMFWKWVEMEIVPNLYDAEHRRNSKERTRFLADGYSYLLGTAILRQQRIHPRANCLIPEVAAHLFQGCNPVHLTENNEDTDDHGQGWTTNAKARKNLSLSSPWQYSSGEESNTQYQVWGRTRTFHGGGYIAYLSLDKDTTVQLLQYLQAHSWVDTLTRVVLVEFSIYNANMNILGALVFTVEFTAFGGAFPRFDMYAFRLYRYFTPMQFMYFVCEIIFVVFVAQLTYRVGYQIVRDGRRYFKSFWSFTDLFLIIFSLVVIGLYVARLHYLNASIEAIHEDPQTFYGFLGVAFFDELIAYFSCIIVFIPTIQFLKFLKFNKNFMIFHSTLSRIRTDIFGFMFVFFVSLLCFTFWAYTMLKTVAEIYANFGSAFGTMIAMLLGKFSFRLFWPDQAMTAAVGPIFTYTFTLANVFLILNIILTIITIGFKEAREDERFQKSEYEIVQFIIDYVKNLLGLQPPYIPPPPEIEPPTRGKNFTYFQWKLCTIYVTQNQYPRLINFANDTYLEDCVEELEMLANLLSLPQPKQVYEDIYRWEQRL